MVRADVPCRAINKIPGVRATLHQRHMISDTIGADIAIVQRYCTKDGYAQYKAIRSGKAKVIYDIDDDLFSIPEHMKKEWPLFLQPETRNNIVNMMNESDLVTVSTERMADAMSQFTSVPIVIVDNCVDIGHADWSMGQEIAPDDSVVIGWHGSVVHVGDIPIIAEAIKTVMKERPSVRFKLNGHFTHELFNGELKEFGDRVTMDGWIEPVMLYTQLRQVDIAISPLANHQFNMCKSNIKWLEYASVEVPMVATKAPPYSMLVDGRDVLFANTTDEWVSKLLALVDNSDYRRRIGLAAKLRAVKQFDNTVVARSWVGVFNRVLGKKD